MKTRLGGAWAAGLFCLLCAAHSQGQDFAFQINQAASGGSAQLHVQASTSGTLIGNYDATTTPLGTHTKPGFFAPGATENVSVAVHSFNPDAQGQVTFAPTGIFSTHFDPADGTMTLADFTADLLGGGTASIPVTAAISFDTFRTSNPSSTYLGIPLTLPLGSAVVSGLTATQVPGDVSGTLIPLGNNQYSFTVTPMVIIQAKVDFQGSPLDVATNPTPFLLSGQLAITGDTAQITESAPLDLTSSVAPATALSPLPFDLPAGASSAHVIFNLTLNTQDTDVQGTQSLVAGGVAVPEPGALMALGYLAIAGLIFRPIRRRNFSGAFAPDFG
jgi:hypothetical protein